VRVRPVSQETCETKSIRPTRYLIVKDLAAYSRAEEETLISRGSCQRLFPLSFERTSASRSGPSTRSVAARCASKRTHNLSSTTFCIFFWKRSSRSFSPFGFLVRRGAFLGEPRPLVNLFLHLLSKNFRPPAFRPSGQLVRRGAFLGEPRHRVNRFSKQTAYF